MNNEDNDELEMIAEVASLYYQDDMNQQQIANELYYSRSKVSRMLKKAKELNVVEVSINFPLDRVKSLEIQLKRAFNLNEVIVVKNKNHDEDKMLQRVCSMGSKFVDELLHDGMSVGLSWGTTMYHLIKALKPIRKKEIKIVQITGVIPNMNEKNYDASELVRKMADKYSGEFISLHAPLYVTNKDVSDMLLEQSIIKETLEIAKSVDLIVTGLSNFDANTNVIWEKSLSKEVKQNLLDKGAVGIFLSHFINEDGQLADQEFDDQIMAIKLDDVKKVKNVITIATGTRKAKAVIAALKGGYINTLIVDDVLANELRKYLV